MDHDRVQEIVDLSRDWNDDEDVAALFSRKLLMLASQEAYSFLNPSGITDARIDALCDLMRAEIKADLLQRWAADPNAAPAEGE